MVFPISNPTEKIEAIPADVLSWSNGKALVATGIPVDPVQYNPSIDSSIFPATPVGNFWTSTPTQPAQNANWILIFDFGRVYNPQGLGNAFYVRCVK